MVSLKNTMGRSTFSFSFIVVINSTWLLNEVSCYAGGWLNVSFFFCLILPEQMLMVFLSVLFNDLSETSHVKTFPVFHSVWGTGSWLLTVTRPFAPTLVSSVDADVCWDPDIHLIWGLKPHAEHKSVCGCDSSLGARESSIDGSTKYIKRYTVYQSNNQKRNE